MFFFFVAGWDILLDINGGAQRSPSAHQPCQVWVQPCVRNTAGQGQSLSQGLELQLTAACSLAGIMKQLKLLSQNCT